MLRYLKDEKHNTTICEETKQKSLLSLVLVNKNSNKFSGMNDNNNKHKFTPPTVEK
jgi:hypothetical protein